MAGKYEAATPNRWITDPKIRNYAYKVLASVGPVVLFYGIMTAEEFAVWFGLAGTVLGTPAGTLAAANTPKKVAE